jgi:N-acetylmuramoyl-L-alanine amidase
MVSASHSLTIKRVGLFGCWTLLFLLALFVPAPVEAASPRFYTVIIDAGHGGFDRGGIPGQRVSEKFMTLDVAQRLAKQLRRAGYRVVMTRDSDVFVTLGDRVRIANSYRDGIFVCIHFNSATRAGANGIETYYYTNQSASLAANIHRQVVAGTTTDNRGIRQRGYYVLRRTAIPAVLVECGFLTNPMEAGMVLQSSYREMLAQRIANGVMGKAPESYRPVIAGLTHFSPPVRQPFDDFVRAAPERSTTTYHSRRSHSTKHSSSSRKKKKSSSSSSRKKKKKSSDSNDQ